MKKIRVEDVRMGMYVHEMCGSWIDHPFWKKSFLVADERTLRMVKECGIREIWIDRSKGVDVEEGTDSISEQDAEIQVERALQSVMDDGDCEPPRVSMQEEMERARRIHAKAKEAVTTMFQQVRWGKALEYGMAEAVVEEITASVTRNPCALLNLARLKNRDDYTYLHSVAVGTLMVALGRQLGLVGENLKQAGIAGLLHDVGKVRTPAAILNKPDSLTREEFEIMKLHPRHGWEILNNAGSASDIVLDVSLHHHERIDGAGYPDRLAGESISLFARMGAVCDVYDAITSDRCYKPAWEPCEAIRKMVEWKDGNYDETIFHAFVKTVGIYPVGTLVRLASGRIGVVADQNACSLLTPKLVVFYSTRHQEHLYPTRVDLAKSRDGIASIEKTDEWNFDPMMLRRLVELEF